MVHYTDERIAELILSGFAGRRIAVMAPVVKGRKGHYRELFETLARKGYIYARIDGEIREISAGMRLDRYKIHTIDLVVDRLVVGGESAERLMTSLREAMRQGKGTMAVYDYGTEQQRFYSRHLMCPSTGIAFEDPAPHTFSFNSPKGACPHCNGLGEEAVFDLEKIVPDPGLSLREGAVEPLGKYRNNLLFAMLEMLGRRYDFTLDDPVSSFSEEGLNAVLYGDSEPLTVDLSEFSSSGGRQFLQWEGVAEVVYQRGVLEQIGQNINKFNMILLLFGGTLLIIALILLNNTIRVTIFSKRYIINTMKLVGATKWFIMRPFLSRSILQGIYAGLIAWAMLIVMMMGLHEGLPEIKFVSDDNYLALIFAGTMAGGVLISLLFTAFAVRKFLRMSSSKIHIY